MKILSDKNILIISTEPWTHDFVTKHHYAAMLARVGNKVYFLNPPGGETGCHSTNIDNIFVVDYISRVVGINHLPWRVAKWLMRLEIRRLLRMLNVNFQVVWSFDPFRFQDLSAFNASYAIYYAADMHDLTDRQKRLANCADLVLAPSQTILDAIDTARQKLKISHGVPDSFFRDQKPDSPLPGQQAIKIVYVGNLGSKFLAYELMRQTISENPQCDFVFVGNEKQMPSSIRELKNTFFCGRLENPKIPAILKQADILWLCYDTDRYTKEASNSHKIMEYLSSGKVVVSTRIEEYNNQSAIITPEENRLLPQLMKSVVQQLEQYNRPEQMESRIQFARGNTYDKLLERIDDLLFKIPNKRK